MTLSILIKQQQQIILLWLVLSWLQLNWPI